MRWEKKRPSGLGGQAAARMVDVDQGMPKDIASALRKTRRMSPAQAIEWADGALSSIGRNLADHRRDPARSGDHLRAAQSDAAALYACLMAATGALPATEPTVAVPGSEMGVAAMRQG